MRTPVIGVMGGATLSDSEYKHVYELGKHIAANGWILLNGGRDAGVMRASAEGAHAGGGTTLGILPGTQKKEVNPFIDIAVMTGMGNARNAINVLSSDVVVACRGGSGTLSEIALALKACKPIVLYRHPLSSQLQTLAGTHHFAVANTPATVIETIQTLLSP